MSVLPFLVGLPVVVCCGSVVLGSNTDGGLLDYDLPKVMVTVKIGRHTVEMYDNIEELPIVRFHKLQKYILIDAGVGGDIASFDQRTERARRFLMQGKAEQAQREFENLRQCVYLIQNEITPKHRAFACLVAKIDGEQRDDLSDNGITATLELIKDTPVGAVDAALASAKKKIDADLRLYYPQMFEDASIKEYYDLLKKRTLSILDGIISGERDDAKIDHLTALLVTFSNPQVFIGKDSAEVSLDKSFNDMCLSLSEVLHIRPKDCTVQEFYGAFSFLQEKNKRNSLKK